ncbi:uncharacterized protein GLRG_00047 [Colletotrichum graminicola M1.001]|uniref:Uncharacterized protein n=1 Tax=Colletotrichum graminicola (strain M1.001 / M2 / FGSC 10212) TaxID=645133 RepID=E3Q2S4_COLGM|nr:uncharacterized protein GLRG_00047 [Colletotrichum graminicola M1.001]EFQ24903.1 hypothetical protein GLRG_00047 [Colletotrichum graminicola M1.001]
MDASTLPATFATSSNALSIVERISASPQGLCRFKSFLDIGYVRLAEALRLHTDRVKDMGLHSREALSGVAPRPLNYLTWSEWSFGPGGRNLLWIKGKPGSGKSTLLKKTLRRLEAAGLPSSVLVASFFFTARSNVKLQNSALGLFQAILYTLLTEDKALLSAFIPVYRRKCAAHEGRRKWQEEELRAFFKSAYSGEYPGIKNAVGVIDALDEVRSESYDEAYRVAQDFVSFFKDLTEKGKLKVCLSSRHFPNFQVADCDQIVVEDFNKDDIVRFVNGKFPNPQNPARANRLAERVAEQANGVFIWVTVVVGRLKSGLDNGMTDPGLERVLEELPSELEKLFEGVLDSAMSRAKMRKAEEIFQWVLLSQRPLEKDELQHILTISRHQDDGSAATTASIEHWSTSKDCLNGDPEKFLMQLRLHTRGLAEVVLLRESSEYEESLESLEEALWQDTDDYEDPMVSGYGIKAPWRNDWSPVQFIHESVREFLLLDNGLSFLQVDGIQRSLSERHEILAECCVACILQGSHFLQIYQPGKVQGTRALSETDLPFLHYALSGVFYHARQVERSGMLAEKVMRQLADVRRTFWMAWQFVASMDSQGEDAWNSRTPTLLHLIAHHRMFLSASFVLKLGFDIGAQDGRGDSALHCAARGGIVETAQFLIGDQVGNGLGAANVNLENKCGETALHLAIKSEEVGMVELLLRHGANTSIQNKRGDAAMHIALGTTGCSIVQMLVKYGADVHLRNRTGEMAVHIASRIPNVSILESLIQQGGDINAKDRRGMTPIHHRIKHNFEMRPLVRLGADDLMFIKDSHGMTAFHYAAGKTSAAMMRRFLALVQGQSKRSRLLSSQDRFGQTALHLAAKRDNLNIFRVLLEAGANLELCDKNGIKPVDYAADKVSREPSLERQLFLLGYRRILRRQNGRMVSGQPEDLGLNPEGYALFMADVLAFIHWSARVDANDVEFVLSQNRPPATPEAEAPACKSFWRNDLYYPRPGSDNKNDQRLWDIFQGRFLETSGRLLEEEPDAVRQLPQRLVELIGQARGKFSRGIDVW